MPDSPATVIRNIDWLVAWNEAEGRHGYQRGGDLAFAGDTLVQVGGRYDGPAGAEIDGSTLLVTPGLINVHSHPLSEPMAKGFGEDAGNPRLGMSGLYDYMPVYGPDFDGMPACAAVAYAELLKSGVTTLVDLSIPYPGWMETMAASGLRGVLAPMFRSARWFTRNGHQVEYDWSEDGGKAAMAAAMEVVDGALNHRSGRLSAMVVPSQIDTCTEVLLKNAQAAARERRIPLHIHAAQSLVEFREITARHGKTPLEWLEFLGLLNEGLIVAHCIFLDDHSWIYWGERGDRKRLYESGAAVAHCPNVFLRHGMMLESFAAYRDAGVRVGIGTDTFPHNMLEELRWAATGSRTAERRVEGSTTADVFDAATSGGAALLGRDDIGRLTPGAKADLVCTDLNHPAMRPVRDPLRSLIFTAADRAVRDVYVGGEQVLRDGQPTRIDLKDALDRMDLARQAAEDGVAEKDWGGRDGLTLSPLAFPTDS